jgi:hypothetical protein
VSGLSIKDGAEVECGGRRFIIAIFAHPLEKFRRTSDHASDNEGVQNGHACLA